MEYIKFLPKNTLSRFTGRIACTEEPKWLVERVKRWFVDRYKLNMAEAEKPMAEYRSLSALFTRRLKPGARPIDDGIVHPCDGLLTQVGLIEEGQLLQTKGISYSIENFLKDEQAGQHFQGGTYLTYYLCPTDYHRVHAPIDAEVSQIIHVPGQLWPVNPWSVENITQLFAVNERLIFHLETAVGKVILVMIGATNVGQIEVPFDPDIRTNFSAQPHSPLRKTYSQPRAIKKGEELGVFNMGSSVVVLYPEGVIKSLPESGPVRLGTRVD